jgi:hypothetical protein
MVQTKNQQHLPSRALAIKTAKKCTTKIQKITAKQANATIPICVDL